MSKFKVCNCIGKFSWELSSLAGLFYARLLKNIQSNDVLRLFKGFSYKGAF